MDYNSVTRRIYTDLDSIYDTRLVLLGMIDSRLVTEYLEREYDIPDYILYMSEDVLENMFKTRDKRLLLQAKNTSVVELIRNICSSITYSNSVSTGVNDSIELIINVYPYSLTENEKNNIKDFMSKYILHLSDVTIIDEEELSKEAVRKLGIIIRRDGLDWFTRLKIKHPELKIPNVKLIVPDNIKRAGLQGMDIDINKMIEYVQVGLHQDISLDVVDKEIFMYKIGNSHIVE